MPDWWVVINGYGGAHTAQAPTRVEARRQVHARVAQAFEEGGLSPSAGRRAASTYALRVLGHPTDRDTAARAAEAWEANRCDEAIALLGIPPRTPQARTQPRGDT